MFLPFQPGELPAHFMALANLTRLRMLQRLGVAGEQSVMDLAAYLRMSQPRISWHLRMLRLGGVIRTRREGRQVYCSLDTEAIRMRQMELLRLLETGEGVMGASEVKA
jgi:ArsR family transcriptional regulator